MGVLCPNTGENYACLDFSRFCEEVGRLVAEQLGSDYETGIRNVKKNNQKEFCSLTIRDGNSEVVPAIYMESFYDSYEKGMSVPEIAKSVVRIYEEHKNPWPDGVDFTFEGTKNKIVFRMVNAEKNREMLKRTPHFILSDLAVYFCCIVSGDNGCLSSFVISDDIAESWGVKRSGLMKLALENTPKLLPPQLDPIEKVLVGLILNGMDREDLTESEREMRTQAAMKLEKGNLPMYVLSNDRGQYGAGTLLNIPFMDGFLNRVEEDFYILPSSIHELILVPVSAAVSEDRLLQMVHEVNEREVPEEDFLSDSVYRYGELRDRIAEILNEGEE
ncbi:MAG: hypothetical protein J5648_05855 [Lachnospiraceae bacterium]|nr:hypothetical protein [Lachnospiraceae bacterium]